MVIIQSTREGKYLYFKLCKTQVRNGNILCMWKATLKKKIMWPLLSVRNHAVYPWCQVVSWQDLWLILLSACDKRPWLCYCFPWTHVDAVQVIAITFYAAFKHLCPPIGQTLANESSNLEKKPVPSSLKVDIAVQYSKILQVLTK